MGRQLVQLESQLNQSKLEMKSVKDENQSLRDRCSTLESLKLQAS
jgi:cell shape-determining protein MreC